MSSKRFIVVTNSQGGSKRALAILEKVLPVFSAAGAELDVRDTEYPGHAGDMVNELDISEWDGLCLVGGDGTLHEVVNGLLTRTDSDQIPIGCIPAGTGNSFMHDLDCLDPVRAAKNIVRGETQPIDVARIQTGGETVFAFNVVGWGMVTDINLTAEKIRWLGDSRYTISTVLHLMKLTPRQAVLTIDGEKDEDEFIFAMGCNTQHTGKGMRLAPHAKLDDGLIDLVVVRQGNRRQLLKLFPKVFDGSHFSDPLVEYHQVKGYSLYSPETAILNVDGELKAGTPFEVEMIPRAFRVYM